MAISNALNSAIAKRLSKHRLFYVCRDVERAFVPGLSLGNYYIITNSNTYSAKLAKSNNNIILIKNKQPLDTAELLQHLEVKKIIQAKDFVVVFKNNAIVKNICQKNKWQLLNPDFKLADEIESKISQITWLGKLAKYLPPHKVDLCQNINWGGEKFILQFNHSHTGAGTFLINSKKQLAELKNKFPNREVRTMKFINGPVLTNNNVVWGEKTLIGNVNYQITGLSPFTDNKFTTIGNDWSLPPKILNNNQIKQYEKIAQDIGTKMAKNGWKGLFGIDMIMDEKSGQLYLLEINARQPASTTFESQLQTIVILSETKNPLHTKQKGSFAKAQDDNEQITTFEAHLASLLNIPNKNYKLISIDNGAQIIQRVTKNISNPKFILKNKSILNVINYKNKTIGSDLVRIQCQEGLVAKHNVLNKLGKNIRDSIC